MTGQKFKQQFVETNGININVRSLGEGPLVLFVHGFPELWYSWRHQMEAVAEKGFKAAALDVRGYGESDAPAEVDQYLMAKLNDDVAGVIKGLGYDKAVLVGHDWGAPIVWQTTLRHSDLVSAVVGMSVPHFARGEIPPLQLWKSIYADKNLFFYQNYFQEIGVAESEFENDLENMLKIMYYWVSGKGRAELRALNIKLDKPVDSNMATGYPPTPDLHYMSQSDLDYYVANFTKSGLRGPINRYRCQDIDWRGTSHWSREDQIIACPALFIAGTDDPVLEFVQGVDPVALMQPLLPNLHDAILLEGIGHWVQQEAPEQVNTALVNFLQQL